MAKLDLKLHPVKTKIVSMWDGKEGFDFLGMHHRRMTTETSKGQLYKETYQYPSRKAMKKMKAEIKKNVNGRSLLVAKEEDLIKNLNPKIIGWKNYYSTKTNETWMQELDWYIICTFTRWYNKKHQRRKHMSRVGFVRNSIYEKGLKKMAKKHLESVFIAISERDIKSYELAVVELKERISRIIDENAKLNDAISNIATLGLDYSKMTEAQQYELGAYVNLMNASTQLLINPIKDLSPKFSMTDLDGFMAWKDRKTDKSIYEDNKDFIVSLANLLYKIELDDREKKLLWKSLRKNKKMLKSMDISKKEFDMDLMNGILDALRYKYIQNEKLV